MVLLTDAPRELFWQFNSHNSWPIILKTRFITFGYVSIKLAQMIIMSVDVWLSLNTDENKALMVLCKTSLNASDMSASYEYQKMGLDHFFPFIGVWSGTVGISTFPPPFSSVANKTPLHVNMISRPSPARPAPIALHCGCHQPHTAWLAVGRPRRTDPAWRAPLLSRCISRSDVRT